MRIITVILLLSEWDNIKEFWLGASETLKAKEQEKSFGGNWNGPKPAFKNLRWNN